MAITEEDRQRFDLVCDNVLSSRIQTFEEGNVAPEAPDKKACSGNLQGVGTLQEKTIHAVLKNYLEPDRSKHEQKVEGFVADIFTGKEIIEIQTKGFFRLRRKLQRFLPQYPVTVVYPVTHRKWLRWVNEETGEISAARKSPKTGSVHNIFPELYGIKMLLPDERLTFRIVLMDVEEYRLLNGWSRDKKKGSTRNDGIPTMLYDEIVLHTIEDFRGLIPEGLPEEFTTQDYKTCLKCSRGLAGVELNLLAHMGVIEKVGKRGNFILYRMT